MPIPTPQNENDLGSCIRALRREGYNDNEQRVAICLDTFRKAHGKPAYKKDKK